jgi:hypothetical protein
MRKVMQNRKEYNTEKQEVLKKKWKNKVMHDSALEI